MVLSDPKICAFHWNILFFPKMFSSYCFWDNDLFHQKHFFFKFANLQQQNYIIINIKHLALSLTKFLTVSLKNNHSRLCQKYTASSVYILWIRIFFSSHTPLYWFLGQTFLVMLRYTIQLTTSLLVENMCHSSDSIAIHFWGKGRVRSSIL